MFDFDEQGQLIIPHAIHLTKGSDIFHLGYHFGLYHQPKEKELVLQGVTYLISNKAPTFEEVVPLISDKYKGDKVKDLTFMAPEDPRKLQLMYGYLNYLHSQNESWVTKVEVNITEENTNE
jgi:hypothetical protein